MEINPSQDPLLLFQDWLAAAEKTEPSNSNAMALATSTPDGRPSCRMVLLKNADHNGFTFYTNMESRKGGELAVNPHVALCFYWRTQNRQVRVEGRVTRVAAPVADAYFKTRHYLSRIGAWASRQSQPLQSRDALAAQMKAIEARFGAEVPRPPHWSGFCVVPKTIEFWQQGDHRLHDRFLFTREEGGWTLQRLNP